MSGNSKHIYKESEYENLRTAGWLAGEVLHLAGAMCVPGANLLEIDKFAHDWITEKGHKPTFLGYHGFPNTLCISVNEQIVHGIPNERLLKEGDIVSIDVGVTVTAEHEGQDKTYVGDNAFTFPVGEITPKIKRLLKVNNDGLWAGLDAIKAGNMISDIAKAVEAVVKPLRYGNVKEYGGHGIGPDYHCQPFIPNYESFFKFQADEEIEVGMVLAVEPMFCLGNSTTKKHRDGWTVVTADRKPAAHFEHSALVKADGIEIITDARKTREMFKEFAEA
jgi:methionyl aminopeptidase